MVWLCCASSVALLSFLVFVCFEFLDFPVKCAQAGWLLEIGVYCLFMIVDTLDMDLAIDTFETIVHNMSQQHSNKLFAQAIGSHMFRNSAEGYVSKPFGNVALLVSICVYPSTQQARNTKAWT